MYVSRGDRLAQFGRIAVLTACLASLQLAAVSAQQIFVSTSEDVAGLSRIRPDALDLRAVELVRRLRQQDPGDTRLHYLWALMKADVKDYHAAMEGIEQTVRLDAGNLDAWKAQIWLAVATKRYDAAASSMRWLATQIPQEYVSPAQEQTTLQFVELMGRICGFIEGPAGDNAGVALKSVIEGHVVARLTSDQQYVFNAVRDRVLQDYQDRLQKIEQLRSFAADRSTQVLEGRGVELEDERQFVISELGRIDDSRQNGRTMANEERNMVATTRDKSYEFSNNDEFEDYVRVDKDKFTASGGKNEDWQVDHDRAGESHRSGASQRSGSQQDRGLDDRHYVDINRRAAEYQRWLDNRERSLERRLRRISSDLAANRRQAATEIDPQVRSSMAKAQALSTYVKFPLHTPDAIRGVLATVTSSEGRTGRATTVAATLASAR